MICRYNRDRSSEQQKYNICRTTFIKKKQQPNNNRNILRVSQEKELQSKLFVPCEKSQRQLFL